MRILYLTPTAVFSGGERITLDIAAAMRERGHETVYCGLEGAVRGFAEAAGVPFIALPSFTPGAVRAVVKEQKPDLIHTMDFRASTYAALTGVPLVAHLHNDPTWLGGLGPNVWAMLYFCSRAGRILTVSESVMDEFRFGSRFSGKTTVLPNTVDLDAVCAAAQAPAPEGLDTLSPDLLFFGRMTEQKDPLRFVELTAALKKRLGSVTAVMIGDGELMPEVKARISALGLDDSVTLTGFLAEPHPVAAKAKLLVMPSKWEGFGLTCVESMALGLPCLVSPVGGLKTLVTPKCGAVCASDEAFLREAETLLTDREAYSARSEAAKQHAGRFGDRAGYFASVEAVYRRILKKRRPLR